MRLSPPSSRTQEHPALDDKLPEVSQFFAAEPDAVDVTKAREAPSVEAVEWSPGQGFYGSQGVLMQRDAAPMYGGGKPGFVRGQQPTYSRQTPYAPNYQPYYNSNPMR